MSWGTPIGIENVFNPGDIAGLKLWLKPEALDLNDGDAIATWEDSSFTNHDASQSNASFTPTFETNVIGSHSGIYFGDSKFLSIPSNLGFDGYPTTVLFSMYMPTTSAKGVVFSYGDANAGWAVGVGAGDFEGYGNQFLGLYNQVRWLRSGIYFDAGVNVGMFKINPSQLPYFSKNNGDPLSFPGSGMSGGSSQTFVGGQQGMNRFLDTATLFEILVYDTMLTNAEITSVHDYLANKYS